MAECLLNITTQSISFDDLTATPDDVNLDKVFLGKGSEELQYGKIPVRGSPVVDFPMNGEYVLPEGSYSGGSVRQKLQTLDETKVTPGKKAIIIPTKDRYMGGNIVVKSLYNLTPEVIKLGEFVGGVGPGLFRGHIVDPESPSTFYHNGVFGPSQWLSEYPANKCAEKLIRTDRKDHIEFYSGGKGSFLVFERGIDLTVQRRLTIEYTAWGLSPGDHVYNSVYLSRNKWRNEGDLILSMDRLMHKSGSIDNSRNNKMNLDQYNFELSNDAYLQCSFTCTSPGIYIALYSVRFT